MLPIFCRWPVLIHQEATLQLKHIVNEDGMVHIQRFYDKPRIGVKTRSGAAIMMNTFQGSFQFRVIRVAWWFKHHRQDYCL